VPTAASIAGRAPRGGHLNGAFVTAKGRTRRLDALDPIFHDPTARASQKTWFGGDLCPNVVESTVRSGRHRPLSGPQNRSVKGTTLPRQHAALRPGVTASQHPCCDLFPPASRAPLSGRG